MLVIYNILKKVLPNWFYIYLQNYKRLLTLPRDIRKIVKSLSKDDVCLDFGANVGIYSQLFAKYESKVYSFEPDPVPFKLLYEKSQKFKNIYPIMKAVGTSNTSGKLYLDRDYKQDELFYSEHNSLVKEKDNLGESYIDVEILDIAEWLKNFDKIKFIKMDVEGYEVELVNHLIKSKMINKIEYIFLETHEKRIFGLNKKINVLKQEIKRLAIEDKFYWNWP
jgi:FkbM family methyltransferase